MYFIAALDRVIEVLRALNELLSASALTVSNCGNDKATYHAQTAAGTGWKIILSVGLIRMVKNVLLSVSICIDCILAYILDKWITGKLQ
jgi:hypothetical protein